MEGSGLTETRPRARSAPHHGAAGPSALRAAGASGSHRCRVGQGAGPNSGRTVSAGGCRHRRLVRWVGGRGRRADDASGHQAGGSPARSTIVAAGIRIAAAIIASRARHTCRSQAARHSAHHNSRPMPVATSQSEYRDGVVKISFLLSPASESSCCVRSRQSQDPLLPALNDCVMPCSVSQSRPQAARQAQSSFPSASYAGPRPENILIGSPALELTPWGLVVLNIPDADIRRA